jgi:hypothetical protein
MSKQTNPFAYRKPITLDSLGDLFSHHRAHLGGWSMEDGDGDKGGDSGAGGDKGGDADKGGDKGGGYKPPATQADLDRMISDRLARNNEKFSDYADLKKKAEAHDATLEAAKSDADKAIDAARTEGEKSATEKANGRLIRSEARALAASANFRDPSDAVAFLDLTKVTVGDDGEVDEKAIAEQLKTLAESKPYLVDDGKKVGPKSDKSQGGGAGTEDGSSVSRGREMYESQRPKKSA